ncbi:quinone oxidoreductase family protein [Candidatus Enterococcus courvalinii]|uniref:NADP-dependent oxidoreductase n=1 Tax=Candidatus Enterococcus courvalinii TaxID=2815329 RepID=A0ABS3I256_9ENTE|nr:NADP-dependent oxidoreductase [Enterococcus sp. MSG2901]MBO0482792.1 NADP-dependent oxidoreductase [Enterococcus sp. MSG2901]
MKRFAIKEYGLAQDVFEEIDASPREVKEGRLRVALKAFSINPYDVSLRLGNMKEVRPLKFPYVLGNDGAGVITEVASDVTNFAVGDRVVVHAVGGTYGEEIVVPAKKVAKLPDQMDWAQAAGMVTTGLTAYNLLTHLLDVQPTDVVMIEGASGGVGSSLVQLLHAKGIKVLASASKKNEEKVRALGVAEFAAYDQEDVGERFANQADIVIDATKGSKRGVSGIKIMKSGGRYVALTQLPDLDLREKKSGFYESFVPRKEYQDQEAFSYLLREYEKGTFSVPISQLLPATLENVIQAHQLMEGHPPAGKIVLTLA